MAINAIIRSQPPVGIDLGTTYSVVAYLDAAGRPSTLPNAAGEHLTPTAVLFDADEVVVGREAVRGSITETESYAECFKRDMGGDAYRQPIRKQRVPPEILSALVLERLKQDAADKLGPIKDVVITVPAFFDEVRRKATQDAGKLAGLNVLDIINEPTAAAVAYAYQQDRSSGLMLSKKLRDRVLVCDLGGGTFDVTILEVDGHRFRTVATDGDLQLGGRDFDERVVNLVAERFLEKHGVDPRSDAEDAAQLWLDASDAKHALTERSKTTIVCYHLGLRLRVEITRTEFEEATIDLLERAEAITSQITTHAHLDWAKIDRVLAVGGASRMPMFAQMLARVTGKQPDRSLSADEAVAQGAAIYCGMLIEDGSERGRRHNLINVNSHSLGAVGIDVSTGQPRNSILIPRNTALPCCVTRMFRTARHNQRSVAVNVVEGESQEPEQCIQLGHCVIENLPAALPRDTPVEVQYTYASNGRLSVAARIPTIRQSARVEIRRDRKLTVGNLDSWRARLCGPVTPSGSPRKGDASNTHRAAVRQQLDEQYMQIGQALVAVRSDLPTELERKRKQLVDVANEVGAVQHQLNKLAFGARPAQAAAERIQLGTEIARLRQKLNECSQQERLLQVALGRLAVDSKMDLPGSTHELATITRLRGMLHQ